MTNPTTAKRFIRDESGKRAWVRSAEAPNSELVELVDDWAILIEIHTGALYAIAV